MPIRFVDKIGFWPSLALALKLGLITMEKDSEKLRTLGQEIHNVGEKEAAVPEKSANAPDDATPDPAKPLVDAKPEPEVFHTKPETGKKKWDAWEIASDRDKKAAEKEQDKPRE
jgi:hypothetical protein